MKEVAGKIEEFPENPPWTMFFDGPLYQKYDEFMKTKDFSKILLNTKLRLANFHGSEVVSPAHSVEVDSWDKEQEVDPTGNTYQYVSEDYFQRIKEDEKRRTRRTRAFIIIGFVIMAALAFGTALVIHYLFIPPLEERNPKNFVNVSFSVNTTAPVTPEITHTTPVDEHEAEMSRMLNELLKGAHHHSHDHDHEHILNPDGKIFDDHFITTTQETTSQETTTQDTTSLEATAGDTETTTLTTSTPSPTTTKTAMFILNLRPKIQQEELQGTKLRKVSATTPESKAHIKSKQHTSTIDLNHMDFFGIDESHTTASYLKSTLPGNEFFAMDNITSRQKADSDPTATLTKT